MYRLTLYSLAGIVLYAAALGAVGVLPHSPVSIVLSALYLSGVAYGTNLLFARFVGTKANPESSIITALILALIVGPVALWGSANFGSNILLLTFLATVAMASKYLFTWKGKHIFNPAAVAVVLSAVILEEGASWWVGSSHLVIPVLVLGLLISYKVGRVRMSLTFVAAYVALQVLLSVSALTLLSASVLDLIWGLLVFSPILFFALIMLLEPQTSPKGEGGKILYALFTVVAVVGFQQYLPVGYTLELALITGNLFVFFVSPSMRTAATLTKCRQIAPGIHSFWFIPKRPFRFIPGQFLEWTLYHPRADNRGIRRYFTIASSPTEEGVLLVTKIPENPSTFKQALEELCSGDSAIATGPDGNFVLPRDPQEKCVFIAGGIGITPFRSMVKYLSDSGEKRDIVLLYAVSDPREIIFSKLFERVEGVRTVYTVTDEEKTPDDWIGRRGFVTGTMIASEVLDIAERTFYVSGPPAMVSATLRELSALGVPQKRIRRDYFSGYEEI